MRRREFITLLGGAAASWPLAARAQQPAMPVIGFLRSTAAAGSEALVAAFRRGLNEAGFYEGQNVTVEYRWADDQDDRISELAAELVRRQPVVIGANGLAALALKAATAAIPIVFTTGFDPVRTGLVTSLNRPGGNATGVVFTQTDLAAKQLGLLHELAPKASTIAVLGDANEPELEIELREIEAAGRALGRQILVVKAEANMNSMPCPVQWCERAPARCLSVVAHSSSLDVGNSSRWRPATHCWRAIHHAITSRPAA